MKDYLILVINPGSTSTKLAVFKNEEELAEASINHSVEELAKATNTLEQKNMRIECVYKFLEQNGIKLEDISVIAARGGLTKPINAGTYAINDKMAEELFAKSGAHAASLAGLMAKDISEKYGMSAYVVDAPVVDELEPVARISGHPKISRQSIYHALNTKAVARECAKDMGIPYDKSRFVIAHIGGGVSVGAHKNGRGIDTIDALNGTGPMTPNRTGGLPLAGVVEMAFSGEYTEGELLKLIRSQGGIMAYLGTNDMIDLEKRATENPNSMDALIYRAMAYQIGKEIGAMFAVLEGEADAIILTGGIARSKMIVDYIWKMVSKMAPIKIYPGEREMLALALGALRVLRGEEVAQEYV